MKKNPAYILFFCLSFALITSCGVGEKLKKIHKISIEDLAKTIKSFQNNFKTNYFFESENELEKNLYKTYMSFIKNN